MCQFFEKESGFIYFRVIFSALAARSATIAGIIDSNIIIKEAFFRPTISRPSDLRYHKLDMLVKLLKETRTRYGTPQFLLDFTNTMDMR